jgi:hypothetical protein
VRPWRGHNAHFHVRLACPDRSGNCSDQPEPPPGDGCDAALESLLTEVVTRSVAIDTRSLADPDAVLEEDDWYDEGAGQDEFAGTRGLGRKVLTLDQMPQACRALADADAVFAAAPREPVEREITALYGIAGSRYLWVLPLDRDLAALRFEAAGALPPGLSAAPGLDGGLVIQGAPELPGDFRFGIVGRDGAGVRARFTVAMAVEPGRTQGGGVVVPQTPSAPSPAPAAIPAPSFQARELEVRAFLRDFGGGDCFYAHPVRVADASAEIEAFSYRQAPLYELDTAFRTAMGFEAAIGARLVGPGHCAALTFARQLAERGAPAPTVAIDDVTLGAGGYLSGRVDTPAGMTSVLLVVDPNGDVEVAAGGLRGARSYSYRTRSAVGPHLLVAVASAIGNTVGATAGSGDAVFARLAAEARSGTGPLSVAVRYFTVE